ncbi:N-acetylglucosamine kinase [Paenibacillus nasutitermitis]|uniref:N-acetylglucosamine kinase n=1 Tax=Paenibacillus nasutitermitis TaxID=1652958 RepID=A0A916ZCE7_9BACL|nr:BadF/BadG/BcrA/BcrD ATPase family protein [Paenibacillus nasutitermitis]GGD86410.1 N-acetylglucosamine kinase [Paenibacillus nasutitermitis]
MYLAGIDGGGSKTFAIVTDERGSVLGSGLSGCGNHQMIGASAAVANMSDALRQALRQAGIREEELEFVQFGLAGADRPFDLEKLQPEIAKQLELRQWAIVCDTMEGLRIGSPAYTGVVLVCGSNTNAAGRNRAGAVVQVGGFDELFGDRAGGYYLARQAFGRTIRSWEGREPYSELIRKVPEGLGFTGMEAMIERYLDDNIAEAPLELALIVHEAAAGGDWLSRELLTEMGLELGKSAATVIRKLGDFDGAAIPVVLTGSILQNGRNPLLLQALMKEAGTEHSNCSFVIPKMAPVFGSVLLAMDRLGIPATDEIIANYEQFGGHSK